MNMNTPSLSPKAREQARVALDELKRRGWCKTKYTSNYTNWRNSRVCLMGAIRVAASGHPSYPTKNANDLILAVGQRIPQRRLIDDWNDDEDTTFTDVCGILEDIINS